MGGGKLKDLVCELCRFSCDGKVQSGGMRNGGGMGSQREKKAKYRFRMSCGGRAVIP